MISWIKFEIFGRKSASAVPISLSTSHLPGFQIKPCHSTSLSLSQALIFNSHFHFQNISTSGFQIQPCHSTWFSNKTLSLNLAFTFTQLSILSYENLLQDETLARKYHSCKIFWSVVSIWCIFGWWLVGVWRIVRTRENG